MRLLDLFWVCAEFSSNEISRNFEPPTIMAKLIVLNDTNLYQLSSNGILLGNIIIQIKIFHWNWITIKNDEINIH